MIDDFDIDFALHGTRRAWVCDEVSATLLSDTDWDMPYDDADLDPLDDDDPASCEWVS